MIYSNSCLFTDRKGKWFHAFVQGMILNWTVTIRVKIRTTFIDLPFMKYSQKNQLFDFMGSCRQKKEDIWIFVSLLIPHYVSIFNEHYWSVIIIDITLLIANYYYYLALIIDRYWSFLIDLSSLLIVIDLALLIIIQISLLILHYW